VKRELKRGKRKEIEKSKLINVSIDIYADEFEDCF
jgi:hypothetical protein